MRRLWIVSLVVLSGLLVTACAPPAPPIPTPTASTVPDPTPTGLPLRAAGWEDVMVENLCLDVRGQSTEPSTYRIEIETSARRILERAGMSVTADPAASCDATLSFILRGEALGADYIGLINGFCYTGATASGEATLSAVGHEPISLPLEAEYPPPQRTEDCPRDPSAAPFERVGSEALLQVLGELWGGPVLLAALEDEDPLVRLASMKALGELGSPVEEATPALIEALESEDYELRRAATDALGQMGPGAVPNLLDALEHPLAAVRAGAATALGDIGPEEGVTEALLRALDDDDDEVRQAAAFALGSMGAEAVPILLQLLQDEDEYVRVAAAGGLGEIGPQEGVVPALIAALEDDSSIVRHVAVRSLGKLGLQEGVVPALITALGDEDEYVRSAAGEVLASITGRDFGEDAEAWQAWWEEQ